MLALSIHARCNKKDRFRLSTFITRYNYFKMHTMVDASNYPKGDNRKAHPSARIEYPAPVGWKTQSRVRVYLNGKPIQLDRYQIFSPEKLDNEG